MAVEEEGLGAPEQRRVAFVYGYLGQNDLLGVCTDAEKYLMLAALNLVECVAFAASMPLSGKT